MPSRFLKTVYWAVLIALSLPIFLIFFFSVSGLDNAILPYLHLFITNEVNGQQLLNVQPDDLDHWGVKKLGHQEIILEAVEHLRNFVSIIEMFLFLMMLITSNHCLLFSAL